MRMTAFCGSQSSRFVSTLLPCAGHLPGMFPRGLVTLKTRSRPMEARHPSALDDFFFDLRGYLVLKHAVEPELIDDLNRAIDELPPLEYGQWYGNAQRRDYTASTGLELHNCVEAGEPF